VKSKYAIVLLLGIAGVLSPLAHATEMRITLRAEPLSQTVIAGQSAKINLIRTNPGPQDIRIIEDNAGPTKAEYDFFVRIHDEDGKTPSYTDYGLDMRSPVRGNMVRVDSFKSVPIPAGGSRVSIMDVGKLYQLVRGHTYLVTCSLKIGRWMASYPLTSNWVEIEVK
jgi:hypothetical protein